MIEAIPPVKNPTVSPETLKEPEATTARKEQAPASPGAVEVQTAERREEVTPSSPSFDVRLDSKTLRMYSELRDPETDRVLLRIPASYKPSDEQPAPKPSSHYEDLA